MNTRTWAAVATAAMCVTFVACTKKAASATAPPPPPPAPAAPSTPSPAESPAPPAGPPAESARSRMPDAATRARIQDLLDRIQDAYFDYDRHDIRPDAVAALRQDAQTLGNIIRDYPDFKLTVEGHCDERGSAEYNLGLGDARASGAREYLAALGVPANQLRAISYGKERPLCTLHEEGCWQKNRRAHITQER